MSCGSWNERLVAVGCRLSAVGTVASKDVSKKRCSTPQDLHKAESRKLKADGRQPKSYGKNYPKKVQRTARFVTKPKADS